MSKSLTSQTVSLFSSKLIAYFITAITPIILVRVLNTAQFGAYRQVLFIYSVALVVIKFQLPESLYYFYPRKQGNIHVYLSQTLILLGINGLIGSALILLIFGFFEFLPSGLNINFVIPLALFLLIESIGSLIEHIFVLEKKIFFTFTGNVTNSLLRLMLVVGAVFLFSSVIAILYSLILWSIVRLIATLVYLFKNYPLRLGFLNRKMLKEQLIYCIPIAIGIIIGLVGGQIDKGIISGYMTPQDFALYSLGGLGIMNAVKLLYVSVGNVFVPKFGELAVVNEYESIRLLWHKMILMNAAVTIPIVTFVFIFSSQIISILYTDQYHQAADLLRINLAVLLIQMTGYGYIPKALGRTGTIFAGNLMRFLISVPLSIILILKFGLIGGAIAFVAGFWTNALIQIWACKTSIKTTIRSLLPWNQLYRIVLICIAISIALPLSWRFTGNYYFQVVIGAVYFFPTVLFLLIIFKIIAVDDLIFAFKKRLPGVGSAG